VRYRILVVVFILAAAACGGSSSTTSPSPPNGGGSSSSSGNGSTLTAVIDGATWNQPNVTARYSLTNYKYLEVDSVDGSYNLFGFAFGKFGDTGDLTTGTYEIGPTNTNANFVTVGGTPTWTASPGVGTLPGKGSGRVVLTSFSATAKTASGTFSFTLVNGSSMKTVTNGTFSVKW
jgi:hypothetical protein